MLRVVMTILCLAAACGATASAGTLHPLLQGFLGGRTSPFVHQTAVAPPGGSDLQRAANPTVGVLVMTRDGGRALEEAGLLPPGEERRVRTARWSADAIRRAAGDPSVVALSPGVRCFPSLDSSLVETYTTNTHDASGSPPVYEGLTGEGVVIGIVDSGIDLTHPDFIEEDGGNRVWYAWDQTTGTSEGPTRFDASWFYGKEWTTAEINAGAATEADPDGHGTHVAGIAAGNGRATGNGMPAYTYVGMAPKAIVVVVKTLFYTDSVVDGAAYVFKVAEEFGLPAVVNLSLGTQEGPHDGTDLFDQALNALTGPGRMIVAAAGNDHGDGVHAERIVAAGQSQAVTFVIPAYQPNAGTQDDDVYIDTWFGPAEDFAITVVSPNGWTTGPIRRGEATTPNAPSTPDGFVAIDASHATPNGDTRLTIDVFDKSVTQPPASGEWTIQIESIPVAAPGTVAGEIDLWIAYYTMFTAEGGPRFVQGVEEEEIVAAPASADSILAVGAYVTKRSWIAQDGRRHGYVAQLEHGQIADFSSVGPRRDGAQKPDVTAPGMGIGSSLSGAAQGNYPPLLILPDGKHFILQGTSMAAPHVTGLVALMFQTDPTLTPGRIIDKVRSTARADEQTGAVPDSMWGYGKIDALYATGYVTPAILLDAVATQQGDRVLVRFVLTQEIGNDPMPVWRERIDSGDGRALIGATSPGPERTFTDSTLTETGSYRYWVEMSEGDGRSSLVGPVEVAYRAASALTLACAPHPAIGAVRLAYSLPPGARGEITLHDPTGRRVATLAAIESRDRSGTIVWDRTDARGRALPSGSYWVRLRTDDGRRVARMLTLVD